MKKLERIDSDKTEEVGGPVVAEMQDLSPSN